MKIVCKIAAAAVGSALIGLGGCTSDNETASGIPQLGTHDSSGGNGPARTQAEYGKAMMESQKAAQTQYQEALGKKQGFGQSK